MDYDNDQYDEVIMSFIPTGFFGHYNIQPHYYFKFANGQLINQGSHGLPTMPNFYLSNIDFDNDGLVDIYNGTADYIQNGPEHPWLIRNTHSGFIDVSNSSVNMGSMYYNKSVAFDVDCDGYMDYFNHANSQLLMRNLGNFQFQNITTSAGLSGTNNNGTLAIDVDSDGDLDLIAFDGEQGLVRAYENLLNGNSWLEVVCSDMNGGKNAQFGTKVHCYAGGVEMIRWRDNGNQGMFHFGLGEATHADSVVVDWRTGEKSRRFDIAAGQKIEIFEQCTMPVELSLSTSGYGYTEPGHQTLQSIVVSNATCNIASIDSVVISSSNWTLTHGSTSILPNSDSEFIFAFNPPVNGRFEAIISIYGNTDLSNTDDHTRTEISLLGYGGPIFPAITDLSIQVDQSMSAVLSWSPIVTTIYGNAASPDYYLIFYNERNPDSEDDWYYLIASFEANFTHLFAARHSTQITYRVMAYHGLPAALLSLEVGMPMKEVTTRLSKAEQTIR
jgi:hypothetical protein